MKQIVWLCLVLCFIFPVAVTAQRYNSVPLENDSYRVIESAVLKGLVKPLSSAKPWSLFTVKQALTEILNASSLSEPELVIVKELLNSFERKPGLDLLEGRHYSENTLPGGAALTFETGLNWESNFSVAVPDPSFSTVNMGNMYISGDLGSRLSWIFNIRGGFLDVDRTRMGDRPNPLYIDPKYGEYDGTNTSSDDHTYYYDIPFPSAKSSVYDIPSYFPYTFSKQWEGAVFPPEDLGGYFGWPDSFAFAYEIISEVNSSLLDNRLEFRFGRMRRDWGLGENGTSLAMNAAARPFLAFEGTVLPLEWLRFSFLTGALEYLKVNNQWTDADPYQNLFSLAMLEFDMGKHFRLNFGSATVWPKRFDLGYLFPVNSNFFYQNNVGDFDNLALFGDIEYRWPGKFKVWAGAYLDEVNLKHSPFFHLDRQMYALQGGVKVNVPWLPFGSVTLRYTKVEPYCYTHEYTETPWNRVPTDTAYMNNGESLGFYLPPNSDEALIRIESTFLPGTRAYFQYQMIRHGVDWGWGRVDGSSIYDKITKDDNSEKYFLEDGVYQWNHVFKIGGSFSLKTRRIPLSFFAETGLVITRYTQGGSTEFKDPFDESRDTGVSAGDYSPIDTAQYPSRTGFILSIGFRLFP